MAEKTVEVKTHTRAANPDGLDYYRGIKIRGGKIVSAVKEVESVVEPLIKPRVNVWSGYSRKIKLLRLKSYATLRNQTAILSTAIQIRDFLARLDVRPFILGAIPTPEEILNSELRYYAIVESAEVDGQVTFILIGIVIYDNAAGLIKNILLIDESKTTKNVKTIIALLVKKLSVEAHENLRQFVPTLTLNFRDRDVKMMAILKSLELELPQIIHENNAVSISTQPIIANTEIPNPIELNSAKPIRDEDP